MTSRNDKYTARARTLISEKRAKFGTPLTHISREMESRGLPMVPRVLRRVEAGERSLNIDEVVALFDILSIRLDELFPTSEWKF